MSDLTNLSTDYSTYKIVTGTTQAELSQNINDIIAQGWNADNFIGGVYKEDNLFCQAVRFSPTSAKKAGLYDS